MKTAITVRIDPERLAARRCAEQENRTHASLIETVPRHRTARKGGPDPRRRHVTNTPKVSQAP
ncbi:hypothetical protein [Azospirillum agricola]|uniref:hypothetical protein n=1 Tax=Azospirillum agricola TaxID=1720247 RepID=UPI0011778B4A|nr:hypothetical protein [Azospirillum agricola]